MVTLLIRHTLGFELGFLRKVRYIFKNIFIYLHLLQKQKKRIS